ncbi:type II toxin-antitoxin system RelE/ParE family toxin [Jiella marina]|uniref:type II toxin-antitoxin system RelE/ParE family toxin n=1 Tax=Jiella sp. LLJ827 TaxID=2917712 RepID=UPI002101BACF|nr:type II toxin-antitoxin system RelE/ParE family toxin [Jiella sp. LLJ827]MCQ0990343.1 type II toxin-antitoxin system RelE/ParE family toxin [Jiella sp. LLJ827]
MIYKLSALAEQDFYDIYVEGALQFGEGQAEKYQAGLLHTLSLIAENPQMARERREITPPVRIHPYRAHLIIYTIRANDVFVLRLPRASRDWERLLEP